MSLGWLFVAVSLASAPGPADLEASVLGFADDLFESREYYRAIGEYERYLHACPDCPRVNHARLRIAESYRRGGATERAIELYAELAEVAPDSAEAIDAAWLRARALTDSRQHAQAAAAYLRFAEQHGADGRSADARWFSVWSHVRNRDLDLATTIATAIPSGSPHKEPSISLIEDFAKYDALPRRSPVVAGLLSALIPGAGQAYNGRWRDAMSNLLMNAIWAGATIVAVLQEEYAVAVVTGVAEFFWYGGNIFGAITGAHRFNRIAKRDYFETLERKYLVAEDRAAFSIPLLQFRF